MANPTPRPVVQCDTARFCQTAPFCEHAVPHGHGKYCRPRRCWMVCSGSKTVSCVEVTERARHA